MYGIRQNILNETHEVWSPALQVGYHECHGAICRYYVIQQIERGWGTLSLCSSHMGCPRQQLPHQGDKETWQWKLDSHSVTVFQSYYTCRIWLGTFIDMWCISVHFAKAGQFKGLNTLLVIRPQNLDEQGHSSVWNDWIIKKKQPELPH